MEEGLNWDEELERRIEFLKCKLCGGTNPYVCSCAKEAFLKKKESKGTEFDIRGTEFDMRGTEFDIRKAFGISPANKVYCSECGAFSGIKQCGCAKKLRKLI